jgi:hypothetical protein
MFSPPDDPNGENGLYVTGGLEEKLLSEGAITLVPYRGFHVGDP